MADESENSYGGAGSGAVAGQLVNLLTGGGGNPAAATYQGLENQYNNIALPTFDSSALTPQQEAIAGVYSPLQESAVGYDPASTVNGSSAGQAAQIQALQQMQGYAQGGLNLGDQSALLGAQNSANQTNAGMQGAITAQLAAQGPVSSGQAAALRMLAAQNASNQANQQGTSIAANAQNRAMQATQNAANMGSNLNSQALSQSGQNANILNQFNMANQANKQNVNNANTAYGNQAQQYNINNAQNVGNANVGTNNQFQVYNQGLKNQNAQNTFQDQMQRTNGAAAQGSNFAKSQAAGQQQQADLFGGIGSAIGSFF